MRLDTRRGLWCGIVPCASLLEDETVVCMEGSVVASLSPTGQIRGHQVQICGRYNQGRQLGPTVCQLRQVLPPPHRHEPFLLIGLVGINDGVAPLHSNVRCRSLPSIIEDRAYIHDHAIPALALNVDLYICACKRPRFCLPTSRRTRWGMDRYHSLVE